jgi:DNA polymerase I-like protein with 3'-5' exonuclease and polymerase domains
MMRPLAAIDAETKAIRSRPEYPPRAVGYAVKHGRTTKYLAFGHPTKNNCTRGEAIRYVKQVARDHTPVFHNADFDLEVLEADGIRVKGEYHDTMRLAFLNEPRSLDLGLKPQADEWLGQPPDERDMLKAWILEHVPAAKKRKTKWGEYICEAPGNLVGTYAKGDAQRTLDLFRLWDKDVISYMPEAYAREMALIPIKLDMEQHGIKVRLTKLKREVGAYQKVKDNMERSIHRRLGMKFNVSSSTQLADALIANDLLSTIVRTPTGKISTRRALLEANCTDKKLIEMLAIYGTCQTYIGTFLQNWIDIGEANDQYIQPTFNTVRSTDEYGGGRTKGARTGRLSSSDPNFQNVPSSVAGSPHWKVLEKLRDLLRKQGINFVGLRDYFEPDEGCVFLRRDYNQQELRILAHFEEGAFLDMYLEDPTLDAHDAVRFLVRQNTGMDFPRKHIKQTNFGIIYGMGIAKLAARLDLEDEAARLLKRAVMKAVPGIRTLQKRLRKLADSGEPFYTWGGREYYCEEPMYFDTGDGGKEKRTYEYKMMNTEIQGSAADCTKQGMINVWDNMRHGRIVLQVHDELVVSVPKQHAKKEMERMRDAMEDVKFKLPMLSDGEIGARSWAGMKKLEDRRG